MDIAFPQGESRPLPDTNKLFFTQGVMALLEKPDDGYAGQLLNQARLVICIRRQYQIEPDTSFDGGNDKYFFTVQYPDGESEKGKKLFIAANEVGGLTVMLPSEY
jgi:hypothetical protein